MTNPLNLGTDAGNRFNSMAALAAVAARLTPAGVPQDNTLQRPPRANPVQLPPWFAGMFYGDINAPNNTTIPGRAALQARNDPVIAQLVRDLGAEDSGSPDPMERRQYWIVNVPSSGEAKGGDHHHEAWDQRRGPDDLILHWVEPEFRARLRHAYLLLATDVVRYIFISGGKIDVRPGFEWWIDALFGYQELLDTYGEHWNALRRVIEPDNPTPSSLGSRVIVDPWAIHSWSNVRNCARLAAVLGLDRILIATSFGDGRMLSDAPHPSNDGQGDYYTFGTCIRCCMNFWCWCCGNPQKQSQFSSDYTTLPGCSEIRSTRGRRLLHRDRKVSWTIFYTLPKGRDLVRLPAWRQLRPQPLHASQEPGPDSRDSRHAPPSPGARARESVEPLAVFNSRHGPAQMGKVTSTVALAGRDQNITLPSPML